jgi:multiple sugar transport system substrate-binding protein
MANGLSRRLAAMGMVVGLVVGACSSSTTPVPTTPPASSGGSTAPSSSGASTAPSAAAQPYAGQTVVVNTIEGQEFTAFKDLLPAFEAQTGIKVSYNFIDPTTYQDKLPIQLAAHDSSFDVFFIGSENLPKYVAQGVVEPLDPYLQDATKTPASYDYNDVLQTARDVCTTPDGHVYCVGTHLGASMLFYNKKMFAAAGIAGPPQSTDDVLADALKLTTGSQTGFCMRGDKTQNLLDPIYSWGYWLPFQNNVTGYWFNSKWDFMLGQSPYAAQFGQWYHDIMTKAAPKGITTYLFSNCESDLEQGKVAMWWDDSSFVSDLTDPTKSPSAADLGFTEIPCAAVNPQCVVVGPWAGFINKNSTHKDAAWQVLQFLTSKEAATHAVSVKALANPVRTSVTQDPTLSSAYPADYLAAVAYAGAHGNPVLLPFIPEGVAIIPPISLGLSELASNQGAVADIMATMTAGVNAIMKKAGYPKPVPGVSP